MLGRRSRSRQSSCNQGQKTKTRSTGLRYLLKVAAGTALPEPQYAERADLELAGLLSATLFRFRVQDLVYCACLRCIGSLVAQSLLCKILFPKEVSVVVLTFRRAERFSSGRFVGCLVTFVSIWHPVSPSLSLRFSD